MKTQNIYKLYIENYLTNETKTIGLYKTIKDAQEKAFTTKIINNNYLWRLIRINDNKNFTNRIY